MKRTKKAEKKYFTQAEANAMLPLVRSIVADVAALARAMSERYEPLWKIYHGDGAIDDAHREEFRGLEESLARDQDTMKEYVRELTQLGIELKDLQVGLVDFPCWMEEREVYLCWRLDEPEVAHWHELDAGFAGRQPLNACPAQAGSE